VLVVLFVDLVVESAPVAGNSRFAVKRRHKRRRDILMPLLQIPAGYTDTAARFWIKGFIPGNSCPDTASAVPPASFVSLTDFSSNQCPADSSTPTSPTDGVTDTMVYPVPGMPTYYFRTDERCWSSDMSASPRIQVICGVYKSGDTPANYKVVCSANAGVTRHYRYTLPPGRCYKLVCMQRDSLSASFTTEQITPGTDFGLTGLNIHGSDPCVQVLGFTIPAPPAVVNAAASSINIDATGKTITLHLKGSHTQFPAIEAYGSGGGDTPVTIYRKAPTGPWHIVTSFNLDATGTFPCPGC